LASSLKLAARCPVSGCWPSCAAVVLVFFDAANEIKQQVLVTKVAAAFDVMSAFVVRFYSMMLQE